MKAKTRRTIKRAVSRALEYGKGISAHNDFFDTDYYGQSNKKLVPHKSKKKHYEGSSYNWDTGGI